MVPIIMGALRVVASLAVRRGAQVAMRRMVARFVMRTVKNMRLKGAREAATKINNLSNGLNATEFESILREWIRVDVLPMANRLVPVRTGHLKSTIYGRAAGYNATVGASASYAGYVEKGTSRMKAQPFIQPSVDRNLNKLRVRLTQAIQKKVQ